MEEIWRGIPGFPEYQASNLGEIRSIDRVYTRKDGVTQHYKGKIRKQFTNKDGYYLVKLSKNGITKGYSVHRLVGFAFQDICGQYFEGAEIDHINTITTDNRAENLRWVSHSSNLCNSNTVEKKRERMINRPDKSKWVIKLSKNNEILHFYPSIAEAARDNNLYQGNICMCCKGKIKSSGDFIWKYA